MNGFVDDGWSLLGNDGVEDVTISVNSSPNKFLGSNYNSSMFPAFGGGVLCAKASMLLQVTESNNFINNINLDAPPYGYLLRKCEEPADHCTGLFLMVFYRMFLLLCLFVFCGNIDRNGLIMVLMRTLLLVSSLAPTLFHVQDLVASPAARSFYLLLLQSSTKRYLS